MENTEELCVVQEVGVFGELDIKDPTKKKLKKKDEQDIDALIKESIEKNASI